MPQTTLDQILDELDAPDQRDLGEKGGLFEHGLPNKIVYDYTEDGTLRSIEDSLRRLKTDHLDYAWIHDPAKDFHGDNWLSVFDTAMHGAAKALTQPLAVAVVVRLFGWLAGLDAPTEPPCLSEVWLAHLGIREQMANTSQVGSRQRAFADLMLRGASLRDAPHHEAGQAVYAAA